MPPIAAGLIMLAHTISAAYIGVAPDSVRPIRGAYTMSPEEFIEFTGHKPPIRGFYSKSEEKNYLAVKEYYKDRFIFSQLLHETVHHFQNVLNIKNRCRNEEENHAFTLQGIYLLSLGATWLDPEKERAKYNEGKCK